MVVLNEERSNNIYLNWEKVKEVNSFLYLSSSLNAERDIGEIIAHKCRKARTAFVRLRPALVRGLIRMRTEVRLVETFIKPTLLYGLENAFIRKVDFEKLIAVLNKVR